eukprot:CAMPEP_0172667724 /NCGR_PEP_ID=MMETSP1074-20121228/8613_1 /TAXON_ID=2916 /ORGANISM="Ceratium fusus, Strain PA161109" /LENGTH=300 /DNA_ID=CAMNT_0013484283 /DNA_START=9 /DNA_END=911 /DNA_ORIENTATION=-
MASLQANPRSEHGSTAAAFHARIHELERAGSELQRAGLERERATEELRTANERLKSQLKEQEQHLRDLTKKNQELTSLLAKQADTRVKEFRSLKRQLFDQERGFLRRLAEMSRERGQAIQVMADESYGLQARISKLEKENRELSLNLTHAQAELAADFTPRNCSSSTEAGEAGSCSNWSHSESRRTFSRPSSREPCRLPAEEQSIISSSSKCWPGKGRVDTGGGLNPTAEDDATLKDEKIQLLECELSIQDRKFRLCRLENEKWKKRLEALEAKGLIAKQLEVSRLHRSRSIDGKICGFR